MIANIVNKLTEIPPIDSMPPFTMDETVRFTRANGGFIVKGKTAYVNMLLKMVFNLTSQADIVTKLFDGWDCKMNSMPVPKYKTVTIPCTWLQKSTVDPSYYYLCSYGVGKVARSQLAVTSVANLDGVNNDIYVLIQGSYEVE